MREYDYPSGDVNKSKSKLGLLLILMIGLMIFYVAGGIFFEEEERYECNPDLDDCTDCFSHENCYITDDDFNIIVRFIGNYQLLITNTNPF